MYEIRPLVEVSSQLKRRLDAKYFTFNPEATAPDALFVRSAKVPDELITDSLALISRAGSGVNTINVDLATQNGTAVFNTPGVNANAVKELVLSCMLHSMRPLQPAMEMVQSLEGDYLLEQAEERRSEFIGEELIGKTVGILGLGSIGLQVAKTCNDLGMDVLGFARKNRNEDFFTQVSDLDYLLRQAHFVVILLPLTEGTHHLLSAEKLALMKKNAVLMNFGRGEIVDNQALLTALDAEQLRLYISDFPSKELLHHPRIRLLPHIGGTTDKALKDSALSAFRDMRDFLLYGTTRQAVNFPSLSLPFHAPVRMTLFYKDHPGVIRQISKVIASYQVEIDILSSDRKDGYVYTIIDLDESNYSKLVAMAEVIKEEATIIRIRLLKNIHWAPTIYL